MTRSLLLSVRFHDGRYHGTGDWPPAPARLFQALVVGAAKGAELSYADKAALEWLETLKAPIIAAPAARAGRAFKNYVPNNDLDKFGGDPRRISEIRTPKTIRPHIFDVEIPLLFIWTFDHSASNEDHARTICQIAERLYQLGRGVDMAWAWAEVLSTDEIETRLARYGGAMYRPNKGGGSKALLCPEKGSLASLTKRYDANRTRFRRVQQLSQSPKPRFAKIAYDSPSHRFLFEVRAATFDESFVPWPCERVTELVLNLRDKATRRLKEALPDTTGMIDRVLIGRNATEADKSVRVRIVPLPSIGHNHTDRAVRRVLVDVPPNCPLRVADLAWAFSGLTQTNPTTGEILWNLVRTEERGMLEHYGIDGEEQWSFRVWRTVTPVALPAMRTRRETTGTKRVADEAKVAHAVIQTLRHVGVTTPVASIRVQREPFDRSGARAEVFAVPERFVAHNLRHVEITFAQAVRGPLVIGNGRYLGLGLMAPRKDGFHDVLAFSIMPETNITTADAASLLHTVRRALMSLSGDKQGRVSRLFSGHEPDGAPARAGGHEHIFLATDDTNEDGRIDRLIVAAPWVCDRTTKGKREVRAYFERVSRELTHVRAGRLGVLNLGAAYALAVGDLLVGPARVWESRTPYCPTRHAGRGKAADAAVVRDVVTECERRGLPKPEVKLLELNAGPNGGNLAARLRLRFAVVVEGPIMLGRDSHMGGGLFAAVDEVIQGERHVKQARA